MDMSYNELKPVELHMSKIQKAIGFSGSQVHLRSIEVKWK